jgi:hypothetical protein
MKNILIVESINVKFFVEALIKHLNLANVEVSKAPICSIDDFECLDGLSSAKLTIVLDAIKLKLKKDEIQKVGILIDIDDKNTDERLAFVNTSFDEVFGTANFFDSVGNLKTLAIDESQSVEFATFFTNANGSGELDTVLKEIKSQPSLFSDCLESWQDCLRQHQDINNGNGLKQKDFDKFWVQIYMRYDTCTNQEQKQAGRKCNNEAAMSKPIWNFDHACLNGLREFLQLFN